MSEDLHPMDDLFRTGLNDREESPTPAVWDAIEKELDKKTENPQGAFSAFPEEQQLLRWFYWVVSGFLQLGIICAEFNWQRSRKIHRRQRKHPPGLT